MGSESVIKISVIIPVYNTEKYLSQCLDSVVNQPLKDVEIICVNDGSTDLSGNILENYAKRYSNIRIIYQENQGLSCARNAGIDAATGKYIYFLDSDDMLRAGSLGEMYHLMESRRLDILYFDGDTEYESEELRNLFPSFESLYKRKKEYGIFQNGLELMKRMLAEGDYRVPSWLQILRRDFLIERRLRYYPGILHEDYLFNFTCMIQAEKVAHVAIPFFIRRIRRDSIMTRKKTLNNVLGRCITYDEMMKFIEKNQSRIGESYMQPVLQVADNVLYVAQQTYDFCLDDTERKKIDLLPKWEAYRLKQMLSVNMDESHPFPYYLLPASSKVVLYGAGKIGRRFYQQMRKSRYVDISGWLDRDHIALRAEGLPVDPIEALKNMEYDFVLIAIANAEAAKQVFESLKCAGVMPDKIIWRAEDYQRVYNRQMSIVNKRMEIYDQVAGQSNKKIFLFMTPEHGNMGDYAIAMAERSFLRGCFSEWLLIEATTPDWQNFRTEYKKLVSKEDIIFISGGGFLGDMWENGRIVKEILNSFTENIKFMFPNTLTYKNNAENAMRSDAEFYFMQDKLYIMARERKSCERLRQYGYRPENQIALFPDMALTLEERFSEEEHREGVLLCFRNDVEKTYPDKSIEKIKRRLMEWELPYVETDMHLHKKVRRLEGEYQVRKKMKEFKRSRLVITDRLHGMIFAAITETPCIAFNNSTDKVVGVYEWIKELPYICFWEGEDIPERQIRELYELKACQYENRHIHNEMVHMVEWIKSMKERNK